ncbi:GLUG motif-containing protein, partial [Sedimentisphaera salicampi]|uniref:GLUG motif-containing protein n=1 Tax=Sedimentisphaera salicampi TaxID=1941349 RepID=UPI000B9B1C6F
MCTLRVSLLAAIAAAGIAFGFAAGDGTVNNPYQISTPDHLEAVNIIESSEPNNFNYVLTSDIDLKGRTYDRAVIAPDTDNNRDWHQGARFKGILNGNGYSIIGLTIKSDSHDYLALIGRIDDEGEVRNLTIENADIESSRSGFICVGSVAGVNWGIIENVECSGNLTSTSNGKRIGGLCGFNFEGTIENCYADCSVLGSDNSINLGGLCGWNEDGAILNSYANSYVIGGKELGGLCGKAKGAVFENCFAAGNVSGYGYIGGFCGLSKESYISNCSITGGVSGNVYTGGFIGSASDGYINNSYCQSNVLARFAVGGFSGGNSAEVTNCYSAGTIEVFGDSGYIGGFCGTNWEGSIEHSFWDTEASGMDTSDGGTGLTTAEMQEQSTFTGAGWDFTGEAANGEEDIWFMEAGGYPKLRREGDGTAENPYQISTRADLEAVNDDLSAHYVLINDIDLSGTTYDRAVIAPDTDYSDVDFNGMPFSGSFDGAGYKILNLKVDTSNVTKDYPRSLGLLGIIDGGEVHNLGIENSQISGSNNSFSLGGLCGENRGTIENCYATGSVSGGNSSSDLGGLCGMNWVGTIENCYSTGSVSGDDSLGGLCGYSRGTITNCYAAGSVSGDDYLG